MTYFSASACASRKAFFSSASFSSLAADGLQVLGLVGVVGRFHFCERDFFGGVVGGADLAGSLEGQMLEHVRQAALARGVVHVAGIDKCGVAEDRRLVALANDEREPVGQHFDGDALLKALQILGVGAGCWQAALARQHTQNQQNVQNREKNLNCIQPPSNER